MTELETQLGVMETGVDLMPRPLKNRTLDSLRDERDYLIGLLIKREVGACTPGQVDEWIYSARCAWATHLSSAPSDTVTRLIALARDEG